MKSVVTYLVVMMLLVGCGAARVQSKRPDTHSGNTAVEQKDGYRVGTELKGVASWYGKKFHGRQTANGEIFNQFEMTAAHKKLPFGTILLVTNLDNGKRAEVRINDRGPYVGSRILDLSYEAAKRLDYVSNGKANVSAIIVAFAGKSSASMLSDDALCIGEYNKKWKANRIYSYLTGRFSTIRVVESGETFKVVIGPFETPADKAKIRRRLKGEGYDMTCSLP